MRLDKIHWVDLNEPKKKEYTFTPLNESAETPTFKYRTGATAKDILKPQILAITLYDAVMRYRTNLVKEANAIKDHELFKRGEWKQFEKYGQMIAQFMGANDEQIQKAITNMKNAFIALGKTIGGKDADPEAALDAGLNRMEELDKIFAAKGINDLQPAIRASKFLELLSPEYFTREEIPDGEREDGGPKSRLVPKLKRVNGGKEGPEYEYDINLFIDMIFDARSKKSKRNLGDYVFNNKRAYTVGEILNNMFKGERQNEMIEIFRKLVPANNYLKNGAGVGKTEIAFAMFFGDCSLPKGNGDIALKLKSETSNVEMKGTSAVITNRLIGVDKSLQQGWKNFKEVANPNNMSEKDIFSKYCQGIDTQNAVSERTVKPNEDLDQDEELNAKPQKEKPQVKGKPTKTSSKVNIKSATDVLTCSLPDSVKFKILFGYLLRGYFDQHSINTMLIINTDDDLGNDIGNSALLNQPIINLTYYGDSWKLIGRNGVRDVNKGNWYENGVEILDFFWSEKINIQLKSRDSSGGSGFKAVFFKR